MEGELIAEKLLIGCEVQESLLRHYALRHEEGQNTIASGFLIDQTGLEKLGPLSLKSDSFGFGSKLEATSSLLKGN